MLLALLSHGTVDDAYEAAGVSKSTLWRTMQLSTFQECYRAARRQLVETAISELQSTCAIAVRVLREVAEDKETPSSSRVAAAKTIIEQSIKAIELMDLQERIERLEAMLTAPLNQRNRRA